MIFKSAQKELSRKSDADFRLSFFIQVKFIILQLPKVTTSKVFEGSVNGNKFAFISPVGPLFGQRSDFHNPISIFVY